MSEGNYSHILNIKIWCSNAGTIIDNKSVNAVVKNTFIKEKQDVHNIELKWRKVEWSLINSQFDIGDLIIDSPLNSDILILQTTTKTILTIENKLKEKGILLPSYRLIFKIVKPLVENKTLPGTIGFIEPL